MSEYSIVSLETIHGHYATLDEADSYYMLAEYPREKILYYVYRYPHYTYEDIKILVNKYTFFHAKVKDIQTNISFNSNIPIDIFRYILLEDLTWAPYYTTKRKPGYVVEGAIWSNGMFYQVREDKEKDFQTYEVTLMIDPLTQRSGIFPILESRT